MIDQPNAKLPIVLEAYEQLAEAYAAHVDTKPHNAYYDRPAVMSLLPELAGLRVLDAGCGPGAYAEALADKGADVVAVDCSPKMASLARQRLGERAQVIQADITKPLPFPDSLFDLVVCPLVLEYVEHLEPVYAEFYRVLRAPGAFVFSAQHPFCDFVYYKSDNYFATELVGCEWKGFGNRVFMPCYRRPLADFINPLIQTGFILEKLVEPQPTEEFRLADPEEFEKLSHQPGFICFRARK